jgi:hypothetical protein
MYRFLAHGKWTFRGLAVGQKLSARDSAEGGQILTLERNRTMHYFVIDSLMESS